MAFDLDKINDGEWFPYFESKIKEDGNIEYMEPKGTGSVCIRQLDIETLEKIREATSTRKVEYVHNPKTRAMDRVPYYEQNTDQKKQERLMMWDYAILDWEGEEFMSKGEKIPVTPENKLKLMCVPVFSRFVSHCLEIIDGQKEVEIKN